MKLATLSALIIAALTTAATSPTAHALITLDNASNLRAGIQTAGGGNQLAASQPVSPATYGIPLTLSNWGDTSITTASITGNTISVDISDVRGGTIIDVAASDAFIFFTVSPDTPGDLVSYSLSGTLFSQRPSSEFTSGIFDHNTFQWLYSVDDAPDQLPILTFDGDHNPPPGLTGNLTGQLISGHLYELRLGTTTDCYVADPGSIMTGSFALTLSESSPVPEPASIGCAVASLVLMLATNTRKSRSISRRLM